MDKRHHGDVDDYRKMQAQAMTEAELQNCVVDCAQNLDWKVSWIPDWVFRLAMGSLKRSPRKGRRWAPPGVPDLVLVRDGRLIFAELKSEKGRVRQPQREWLDALEAVPGIEVRVFRPRHWYSGEIEQVLRSRPATAEERKLAA